MPPPQDIFEPVHNAQEKSKILADVLRYSAHVKIKIPDPRSEVFQVTAVSVTGLKLHCRLPTPPIHFDQKDQQVVIQFDLSEQKYIGQVDFELTKANLILDFSGSLFLVQRRADFRLRIPSSFQSKIRIKKDGKNLDCRILDLSAGGCRLEIPAGQSFQIGDHYTGLLIANKRDDLEVEFEVRHVDPHPDKGGPLLAGAQFVNQTQIVKNRMAALVMDLYREFFTKRA